MATFMCWVQFLDDTNPFNSTDFPEPTRPPLYTFREDIPLNNQTAGVHRLLKAPQKGELQDLKVANDLNDFYCRLDRQWTSSEGQCILLRFDGHGQIGPPSPTWNALSGPLRGSSESFSCSSDFSNYTSKWRTAHG
ncbi:unnamed protein product [Pleuronectes platessa]|uniref:FHOD1 N-terminal GTPase-binding domain-containing protein n=1 Tax=Pleuronectes platessa TaxID=8262 RepID=A0A9N7V661_PLEPL|nr:unnamed protein product [Pleuronectes platessa]